MFGEEQADVTREEFLRSPNLAGIETPINFPSCHPETVSFLFFTCFKFCKLQQFSVDTLHRTEMNSEFHRSVSCLSVAQDKLIGTTFELWDRKMHSLFLTALGPVGAVCTPSTITS